MKDELIGLYDDYNNKMVNHEVAETVQAGYSKMHRGNILLIKNGTKQGYLEAEENDCIDLTAATLKNHRGVVQKGKSQTIVCADGGGRGVVIREPKVVAGIGDKNCNNNTQYHMQNRIYEGDVSTTTTTKNNRAPYWLMDDLKIRKLTPRECFRLQGVRDDDIDKLMHMSDTTLYHLAGDAIVVNVLMEIFKEII